MNAVPSRVDLDLLRKYDVPAPRYTSYPTALHFDDAVGPDVVERRLRETADQQRPLSLYFHLPFCQSLCWYCACTRIISKRREDAAEYVDTLLAEIDRRLELMGSREVVQLHLGGGTPTFLPPDQLRRLGAHLHERFDFADDAELAVEIDPRECSPEHVEALREVGFNRASMGVQDNNPTVQEAIHRIQPWEMTREVTERLREAGFESINYDLIYGLPHQTLETFEQTLDDVLQVDPDRFAIYSYAHVPWVNPAQTLLEGDALPGPETKLQLLKLTIERLGEAGYAYIGMDHFARPDNELYEALESGGLRRNFQGYSTWRGTDIHAFGLSAISQVADLYFQNRKELPPYTETVEAGQLPVFRGVRLNRDDLIRREVIEHLMCRPTLEYASLSERLGVPFLAYFGDAIDRLAPLEDDGLVRVTDEAIHITPTGRLFLRNIAMQFDAYLDHSSARKKEHQQRYSKSV